MNPKRELLYDLISCSEGKVESWEIKSYYHYHILIICISASFISFQ